MRVLRSRSHIARPSWVPKIEVNWALIEGAVWGQNSSSQSLGLNVRSSLKRTSDEPEMQLSLRYWPVLRLRGRFWISGGANSRNVFGHHGQALVVRYDGH